MLVIIKRFSKVDGCKASIVLLLQENCGASFGMISIIIPHCLDLLNRYHYAFVPSSLIPAMEQKIMYVYFFLKDPLSYLFKIMYMRGNVKASSCGGTLWKDINHRTNQNKILDQKNKASPLSLCFQCLILMYKNKTKKQVYKPKLLLLLLLIPYFRSL